MNFHTPAPEHPEFTAVRVSAGVTRWDTWESPSAWRFLFWASLVAAELFGLWQVVDGINYDVLEAVVAGVLTCVLAPPVLRILLEGQLLVFVVLLRFARALDALSRRVSSENTRVDA